MAFTDKAQWHKLLNAFLFGQRAKRCLNVVRGNYLPQELLLLKRPLHPGRSFMAKSLISTWTLTSKDYLWSPVLGLILDHLTLRDLVALTMQRDSLTNQSVKRIMADLRLKGVTTVSLLWQAKERLLTLNRHHISSNTVNLLRRVVRVTGLASVKLQHATGWTGKKKALLPSFNRPASEFYKLTKPLGDWTKEINTKWGPKDKRATWNRRWNLIWHSQIHPKDATFVWRMLWQGLYTTTKAQRFGFGDGYCLVCKRRSETIDHLFLACPNISRYWKAMQNDKLLPADPSRPTPVFPSGCQTNVSVLSPNPAIRFSGSTRGDDQQALNSQRIHIALTVATPSTHEQEAGRQTSDNRQKTGEI
ncbi:hypothetical protein R1flu_000023 [Riccia fluitans]|uniref:Reverse transcriptase zinc-binding domain-containing protein n=1 Tax=Riccia fluitans TaxID=41844 RepID=A0ABD1XZF8_9MARC